MWVKGGQDFFLGREKKKYCATCKVIVHCPHREEAFVTIVVGGSNVVLSKMKVFMKKRMCNGALCIKGWHSFTSSYAND